MNAMRQQPQSGKAKGLRTAKKSQRINSGRRLTSTLNPFFNLRTSGACQTIRMSTCQEVKPEVHAGDIVTVRGPSRKLTEQSFPGSLFINFRGQPSPTSARRFSDY